MLVVYILYLDNIYMFDIPYNVITHRDSKEKKLCCACTLGSKETKNPTLFLAKAVKVCMSSSHVNS